MDLLTTVLLVVGLGVLVLGAEWLVRGASRLAAAVGISPLVVGLTVVAFGTSSPELAVSVSSAWKGQPDLAFGNVVGSNIFNVLFILGLSALITALVVARQIIRVEVPVMIGVSFLLAVLAWDGVIGRFDGALLFGLLLTHMGITVRRARAEAKAEPPLEGVESGGSLASSVGFVLVGLVLLVIGSRWLVQGAVAIAQSLGVSELLIGLTIVAAGTSLPEVATSVIAAMRGERDIAVANVVGSNIFNILGVLGVSALVAPDGIPVAPAALAFDLPVMIAVALACAPIFFTGQTIARWEGGLFLGYYVAYTAFLVLAATGHPELETFASAMTTFVLPLTVVTLVVVTWRAWKAPTLR